MSRIYANEEASGKRVLLRLECDAPGCEAFVRPHREIAQSGWIKCGIHRGPGGDHDEWDYCPEHAHLVSEVEQRAKAEEAEWRRRRV